MTPFHARLTADAGRRIAREMAGAAVDPAARLTMADRIALAALALAVDDEVARVTGAEPIGAEARAEFADALARVEATAG